MRFLLSCTPVAGTHGLRWFLAEAPMLDPGIGSLVGNVGVVGALVWFLWYVTSKAQPQAIRDFAETEQKMRDTYERQKGEQRAAFAAALKEQRDAYERQTDELRKILTLNMDSMRRAVHDVKDTVHTAAMQAAADAAARKAAPPECPP